MPNVEVKTNGYELDQEVRRTVTAWEMFLDDNLDVKTFRLFYWSDKTVFADCILTNGHYAQFNIGRSCIHFNGHTCSNEEYEIFGAATIDDELFDGKLVVA